MSWNFQQLPKSCITISPAEMAKSTSRQRVKKWTELPLSTLECGAPFPISPVLTCLHVKYLQCLAWNKEELCKEAFVSCLVFLFCYILPHRGMGRWAIMQFSLRFLSTLFKMRAGSSFQITRYKSAENLLSPEASSCLSGSISEPVPYLSPFIEN